MTSHDGSETKLRLKWMLEMDSKPVQQWVNFPTWVAAHLPPPKPKRITTPEDRIRSAYMRDHPHGRLQVLDSPHGDKRYLMGLCDMIVNTVEEVHLNRKYPWLRRGGRLRRSRTWRVEDYTVSDDMP
jgi:hypothetical protein